MEGPESVAAVFLEPVQNSGGCFPPPPGYFQRVREICDRYGVLLVSDEVICAFGRLGHWFGADRYGYQPDIITVAKGMTSRLLADRRDARQRPAHRAVPRRTPRRSCTASPSPATRCPRAVALANLDLIRERGPARHVRANEGAFRATLEKLYDLPIVGDVRGDGYFYGIELVKDKATRETFDDDESERLLRGFLSGRALRGRAGLPGRRPRRPGHPARPAADLRAAGVRRDRADPARGAHRGMGDSLSAEVAAEASSARTQVRRLPGKQRFSRAALDAILDAGRVGHLATSDEEGQPYVLPVAYARDGDQVLVHGSTGSRLFRSLAAGAPTCLTVTLLDGLVLARSAFESSMRYRSAMVLGSCETIPDDDALRGASRSLTEHLMPRPMGRPRPPMRKEIAATALLALPIDEWSVKVSDGWPEDEPADAGLPIWAGVVPIQQRLGTPIDAPDLPPGLRPPDYCAALAGMSPPDYRRSVFWLDSFAAAGGDLTPRAALPGDIAVDVAIVGAGFTGLWTAYYLRPPRPGAADRRHREGDRRLRRLRPQRRLVQRAVPVVRRKGGPAVVA